MIALGIIAAIAIGVFIGILIVEAMWGGPSAPARLLTEWSESVVKRIQG